MSGLHSSIDYLHVATEEAPRQLHGAGAVTGRFPGEAAHWQCGEQRLALRLKYNMKELDATEIIRKYDTNRSKALDCGELRDLLQDLVGGRPTRENELNFIMQVADKSHDQCISQEEVLVGIRAWYAFNNMPKSVGHAFSKHSTGGGPMPSIEVLKDCLLTLNEHQPVKIDEAAFVRRMAFSVGGSEEHVTVEQMRQAVAVWYLHIERGNTGHAALLGKSAIDTHSKVILRARLSDVFQGECKHTDRETLIIGATMLFLVVVPTLEILMASKFPTTRKCQHPHLSSLLHSTGVLGLLLALGVWSATLATHLKLRSIKICLWVFVATLSAILAVCTAAGASKVLWSSSASCGFTLWHFAHLVWIEVPVLLAAAVCCGLPILYFSMGSQEFLKNHDLDESLMTS